MSILTHYITAAEAARLAEDSDWLAAEPDTIILDCDNGDEYELGVHRVAERYVANVVDDMRSAGDYSAARAFLALYDEARP